MRELYHVALAGCIRARESRQREGRDIEPGIAALNLGPLKIVETSEVMK